MSKKTIGKIYGLGAVAYTAWKCRPSAIAMMKDKTKDCSKVEKVFVCSLAYITTAAIWPLGAIWDAIVNICRKLVSE